MPVFHSSVAAVLPGGEDSPPKTTFDVELPADAIFLLAVFKSDVSVQLVPSHNSVIPKVGSGALFPPDAKALVYVPAGEPPNCDLAVFKLFNSVQLEPFHCSVLVVCGDPPKNKACVEIPEEAPCSLAKFKSATSDQEVPFHNSVTPVALFGGTFPPKPSAAVTVPVPPKPYLAVFKSFTSVQLVPFHCSVTF